MSERPMTPTEMYEKLIREQWQPETPKEWVLASIIRDMSLRMTQLHRKIATSDKKFMTIAEALDEICRHLGITAKAATETTTADATEPKDTTPFPADLSPGPVTPMPTAPPEATAAATATEIPTPDVNTSRAGAAAPIPRKPRNGSKDATP